MTRLAFLNQGIHSFKTEVGLQGVFCGLGIKYEEKK
jgi:hypothetical protein